MTTFMLPVFCGKALAGYAIFDEADSYIARYRWRLSPNGYVVRNQGTDNDSRAIYAHRQLLGLKPGDPRQGDHINRDKLDNRRENLRVVTGAQNTQNVPARGGSSRYRGVSWSVAKGKWEAKVTLDYHTHFIGRYGTEEEAAEACRTWRAEHMPFTVEEMIPRG